ncbi:hypothetical protein OnM2_020022 [Erysiphe neolycopersici]|uniref:Helix-turn-helix domain-containing protein n=1 Tax=Erysiphe neolycopersici TaxID=212602 RepID=A0A420I3F3_9PEZI|nr:hypothetical protein OnM2_020022 [Erysiphe neolycopersici]
MGSNSSKAISNPSSLVNTFKYLLNGSRSSGGVIRSYPKRSSINKKSIENRASPPSSLNRENLLSNENTTSSHDTKNFNTSQPKNESDSIDVSLQRRLQNLGPVQRQDVLTNNTFIIPSLSRNDNILQTPESQSSVTSQVVLNPGVSKPKISESPPPSLLTRQQQQQQQQQLSTTSTVLDPASNTRSQFSSTLKTNNSAVALLIARNLFSKEAEAEFANIGKSGSKRRRYLDLDTVTQILVLRDTKGGLGNEEIERRLELGDGVVKLLGKKGVVGIVE